MEEGLASRTEGRNRAGSPSVRGWSPALLCGQPANLSCGKPSQSPVPPLGSRSPGQPTGPDGIGGPLRVAGLFVRCLTLIPETTKMHHNRNALILHRKPTAFIPGSHFLITSLMKALHSLKLVSPLPCNRLMCKLNRAAFCQSQKA